MARLTAAMRLREQLQHLLSDRANYVLLKDGMKKPAGRYRITSGSVPRARKDEIPPKGNYGIIPEKEFFILDLDVLRGNLKQQILFFEKFFGVKLSETLSVQTPSGGRHYYLRIPENFRGQTFNGSLRPYKKYLREIVDSEIDVIDADIRSSGAAGYVVGPTSYVLYGRDGGPYPTPGKYALNAKSKRILESGDFFAILEISKESASALQKMRKEQLSKRSLDKKVEQPSEAESPEILESAVLSDEMPNENTLRRLRAGMNKRMDKNSEFHRKRAFVAGALQCCFTDFAIAAACAKLGIDKDTYTKNRIPFWLTVSDIAKLRLAVPAGHTAYCDVGRIERNYKEKTLEQLIAENKEKVATRTLSRNTKRKTPRVINMNKVLRDLDKGSPKVPQKTLDAVLILDTIFQPLLNVGASQVVIARKPVAEMLNLTESRVAEATRLLREKKVLILKNRQKTGLASTYIIPEEYIHKNLTGFLKHFWSQRLKRTGEVEPIFYNRFLNVLQDFDLTQNYEITETIRRSWRKEFSKVPDVPLNTFPKRYLRME